METLVTEFMAEYQRLRDEADKLDNERGLCSKYYSDMTESERKRFDDLATRAYQLRIEARVYKQCANRVTAYSTTQP